MTEAVIRQVQDFDLADPQTSRIWESADWHELARVGNGPAAYATRAKVLWSAKGIYFLIEAQDRILHCTMTRDFDDLYLEDVAEVFLWPDESQTLYFEYEISPLGMDLPILVPNSRGVFMGWRPWHYHGDRLVRRITSVQGGQRKPMVEISGWTASFFIPFALLKGLGNVPPRSGAVWRANIYRIDYDSGAPTQWAWCPDTGCNFHDYRRFGVFRFAD